MRRFTLLAPLLLLLLLFSPIQAQDINDLNGAWIVTSWTSAEGEVNDEPQRGLYIFLITREDGGSYSIMFVNQAEPRAEYEGENITDSEKLAAYDSFVANSGRLNVDGSSLTYEAYMAKDPNYMSRFGDDGGGNGITAQWDVTDDILTLTFENGGSGTFRRPNSG
jgi:hypothetical protein